MTSKTCKKNLFLSGLGISSFKNRKIIIMIYIIVNKHCHILTSYLEKCIRTEAKLSLIIFLGSVKKI